MTDLLEIDEYGEANLAVRTAARAACHRRHEVYGALLRERDRHWLEVALPWGLRATRRFWSKVVGATPVLGTWWRADRLLVLARAEHTEEVWASARQLAGTLGQINVPRKALVRGKRPFTAISKTAGRQGGLTALLEPILRQQFGLVGRLAFDLDSLEANSPPLERTEGLVDPWFWRGVDYERFVFDRDRAWEWVHRHLPELAGLVRLRGCEFTGETTGVIQFDLLNDSRFLCESNRGKPSLQVEAGVMTVVRADHGWRLRELLVEDYFCWLSPTSHS